MIGLKKNLELLIGFKFSIVPKINFKAKEALGYLFVRIAHKIF